MQQRQRAQLDPADLAVVLSHYELGVIESITEVARGSRRSAKIGLVCDHGKYLLKQRPLSRARPERVSLAHRVQAVLGSAGFPMPKLIPTRDNGGLFVVHRDHLYELFEFIPGHVFSRTRQESRDSGFALARFHDLTRGLSSLAEAQGVTGDYHDSPGVRVGLCSIGSTLSLHDSFTGDEAQLASLMAFLLDAYQNAAEVVNSLGFSNWPERVVHADWHPGNILFREQRIAAVVDYDSVRLSRAITDVANGALHFSIIAGDDPTHWPDHLEEELFHEFIQGYESLSPLVADERRCIPHLMVEALIAECVPPITETGSVGRWSGFRVLEMVRRKLTWINAHSEQLMVHS